MMTNLSSEESSATRNYQENLLSRIVLHHANRKCKKALKQLSNQKPFPNEKSPISTSQLQMNLHNPLQTTTTVNQSLTNLSTRTQFSS